MNASLEESSGILLFARQNIYGLKGRMNMDLLTNLDKIHTTELGVERVRKNLGLVDVDVVEWCKDKIREASNIVKRGKNWYIAIDNVVITVNANSFTIITAHQVKKR